jgi:hypothetical protein
MNFFQARSSSRSEEKDMTSAPTIGAQPPKVMTFFMIGLRSPCTVTYEAIWITESSFASGKWPCTRLALAQRRASASEEHAHLAARALDVDRENAKLAQAAVFSLGGVAHELVVHNIDFKLREAVRHGIREQ